MSVTFNGTDRLIEVDNGTTELDAESDIYSAWKNWQLISDNSKYAPAFGAAPNTTVFGGNPTITGQFAPKYFFLTNGWKVKIDNGEIVSVGLNLYSDDGLSPYIVFPGSGVSDRNSDAVSLNSSTIEFSSFNNKVTVDFNSIYSGVVFPVGTRQAPVNNLSDALSIANTRGLSEIELLSSGTINSGLDFTGFMFTGASETGTMIVIDPSAIVVNCEFRNMTVSGTLDGGAQLTKVIVGNLNYVNGILKECIVDGPITLGGASPLEAIIVDSNSGIAGTSAPTIDMGGDGPDLQVRGHSGGLFLTNKTGINSATIEVEQGNITVDSTCTAGTIVCRGVGTLTDNSGVGCTVIDQMMNPIKLQEIWENMGLDPDHPLVIKTNGSRRTTDNIDLDITDDGTNVTVTRQ